LEKVNRNFEKFKKEFESEHTEEKKKFEKTSSILRKKNEELRQKRKAILSLQTTLKQKLVQTKKLKTTISIVRREKFQMKSKL